MYGEEERCTPDFGGETEENRQIERPRRRRNDNIKVNLMEIGLKVVTGNNLAQNKDKWWALVNATTSTLSSF
jgi:hypothetical protein